MLRIVEAKLMPTVIARLISLGLQRSEIDSAIIPPRTLQHRLREPGARTRWLRNPHPRLRGRSPLSLLNTDTGSRIVEELLVQIDEGMFVQAMILWRISRHRNLSGIGELKASGLWHHAGLPIVYLAGSPSAALLEVCVHTSANDIPPEFTLLEIHGPDVKVLTVKPEDLPQDWTTRLEVTRDLGFAWLRKKSDLLLRVPCAIVPETVNFLFNPIHTDAVKFRVEEEFAYPFDARLKT